MTSPAVPPKQCIYGRRGVIIVLPPQTLGEVFEFAHSWMPEAARGHCGRTTRCSRMNSTSDEGAEFIGYIVVKSSSFVGGSSTQV